ncbi:MAG: RluA family pseudouridine synthase [Candidatus Omnitrophica bacterium]|nr:RluA family pseudouridine synthase [Candidatus Omnitrophota bacterium]MCM8825793.1 RluA family pseudouridine synthase [Candidatus Omnitrophota bacterium]
MKFVFQQASSERLDRFLAQNIKGVSRELCKRLIESGKVTVNGEFSDPARRLKKGDIIELSDTFQMPFCDIQPEAVNLDILFEDRHVIVVNKPAGILTHPLKGVTKGTLLNFILAHTELSKIGLPLRPGVVHRLDRNTSGCIVFAKTDIAYFDLVNQFRQRLVKKVYRAVVEGSFPEGIEKMSLPLKIDKGITKVSVRFSGKNSTTKFKVLKKSKNTTYLEVMPVTGRTHQIRVTLAFLGHPVLGDEAYGRQSPLINRQALHAFSISFSHPETKKQMYFRAKLPADFLNLLEKLEIENAQD